jgi:hypothetical protein
MDEETTRQVSGQKLSIRVTDASGTVLQRSEAPVSLAPGELARTELVLPDLRPTPADLAGGRVVFEMPAGPTEPSGGISTPLERVRGIGRDAVTKLREAGIADAETLLRTPPEKLREVTGKTLRFSRAEALRVSGLRTDPLKKKEGPS